MGARSTVCARIIQCELLHGVAVIIFVPDKTLDRWYERDGRQAALVDEFRLLLLAH